MAAFKDTTKASPGVHVKAKKQALGELKDLMTVAGKGEVAGKKKETEKSHMAGSFEVTRKGGPSVKPAEKGLKRHVDTKSTFKGETKEDVTPDFEEVELDEDGKQHMGDRANPGNLADGEDESGEDPKVHAKEIDKALKNFIVKKKKG
jgi:hypothetical protein